MQERCFGPVRFIPGENHGKYPFCHSVYIEGAGILIDPASDRERLKRLRTIKMSRRSGSVTGMKTISCTSTFSKMCRCLSQNRMRLRSQMLNYF